MHTTLIGGEYHGEVIEHFGLEVIRMPPKPKPAARIDSGTASYADKEIDLLVYTKRHFSMRGEPVSVFALSEMTDEQVAEAIRQ